jgi:hypothetical protein
LGFKFFTFGILLIPSNLLAFRLALLMTARDFPDYDSLAVADGMRLPRPTNSPVYRLAFYCDCSSQRDNQFMVAGGLVIRPERLDSIQAAIQKIKDEARIRGEMKWSEYRGGPRRPAYEALVDLMFLLIRDNQAHFHAIIAHFSEFDHVQSGALRQDSSASKMYFQLALHRLCKDYGRKSLLYLYPDSGNDSVGLIAFREALCISAYRTYTCMPNCVRTVQPRDSYGHNILQMVDVVIGSMAALRNDRKLSRHKNSLARYVLVKAKHGSWSRDTARFRKGFSVWNFKHREIAAP